MIDESGSQLMSTFTHADHSSSKQNTSGALNFHRGPLHLKEALLLASRRWLSDRAPPNAKLHSFGFPKNLHNISISFAKIPLCSTSTFWWALDNKDKREDREEFVACSRVEIEMD